MATLEKIDEKLDRVEKVVTELKVTLLGQNADRGLVGQVGELSRKVSTLRVITAAMVGSGLLGGGAACLLKWLQ